MWRRCWLVILGLALWGLATPARVQAQADDAPILFSASELLVPPTDVPPSPGAELDDPLTRELQSLRQRIDQLEADRNSREDTELAKKLADEKQPTVKWSAQIQSDYYLFNQDEASKSTFGDIENGEAFRRARIAMLGDYGPTEYRLEVDFAQAGRPTFLDVFVGMHDLPVLGRVRVGHFFEPFSLERLTSNRYVTFMERSNPDQPFAPARNLGVMTNNTFAESRGTWAVGYFRSDSNVFGDDVGDNFENAITGRITWLPVYDERCPSEYVHTGFGYSFRGTNDELARFQSQPEARIGAASPNVPSFVDTGNIPSDHFQLVGFEAAWVHGPFSLQGEYMLTPVDRIGLPSVTFTGWYAAATYFLTGEYRPYLTSSGTFDRVMPHGDFVRYGSGRDCDFGPGAWEIAVRLSHLDFNDDTVQGGRLTDFTVGLNWYLNPYLRFTANYIRAFADNPVNSDSVTDIFATRVGFDF